MGSSAHRQKRCACDASSDPAASKIVIRFYMHGRLYYASRDDQIGVQREEKLQRDEDDFLIHAIRLDATVRIPLQ